jgi:deazaflavin-dependent oxidoreductase (nitroreductase family)
MSTPPSQLLPYPDRSILKWSFRLPIQLYRLGLGPIVGRLFMILTTTGRKSSLPRRHVIEFHSFAGRKYVFSAWGDRADWYRNLQADSRVTVQTADGVESMRARRVTGDEDLTQAFRAFEGNALLKSWVKTLGVELTLAEFLAQRDRLFLITFDPTDDPTPPPLPVDLKWVWLPVAGLVAVAVVLLSRLGARRT